MPREIKDGYCQDYNNNLECGFDGGDCCGSCVNKDFCSECECKNKVKNNGVVNGLVGDGFCNDETNNLQCNYDSGDCCGVCVLTDLCLDCKCLGEDNDNKINFLIGNRICNDETNNKDCYYDGGDCSLHPKNTEHCFNCSCSVPGIITSPGYPNQYLPNVELSWLIEVPTGESIELEFDQFDVLDHPDCR